MLKVLTKSVNEYEDLMKNCVTSYIEELSKDFVNTYVQKRTTIEDLEKGYSMFSKSMNNYVEFKDYCKHMASFKNINIRSKLFQKIFQNYFSKLKKQYDHRYYLKNYTNNSSKLGKQYTNFFTYCKKLYIKDKHYEYFHGLNIDSLDASELETLYDIYYDAFKDKLKFINFCKTINSYLRRENQIDTYCNLYKVYLEDHYYVMVNIYNN